MKNFFKKEKSFKKKDFIFYPNFCWRTIITTAGIMILLSFLFGYFLFRQINQDSSASFANESGQTGLVNKERIEKVLNYFFEREKNSAEILNSSTPVIDPSL